MSRPIKLSDEQAAQIAAEFVSDLRQKKLFDGKLSYERTFKWDTDQRAKLGFSTIAFAKMMMLVQSFDSEVAWHGTAYRSTHEDNSFLIQDIMVYPQEVTGSTVNTDQNKYQDWLMSFDDNIFNNIRMQGHSHVNFGTTPSGVDLKHQEEILEQLEDNMFYIFMIWNKKYEFNIKIFDLKNNTLYETQDIDIYLNGVHIDLDGFIKDSKSLVVKKTYGNVYNYGASSKANDKKTTTTTQASPTTDKPKNRTDIGKDWNELHNQDNPYFYGD